MTRITNLLILSALILFSTSENKVSGTSTFTQKVSGTSFSKVSGTKDSDAIVMISDSAVSHDITLINDTVLNRFRYFWSQKQKLKVGQANHYQWRYQIQIRNNNQQQRWVYDLRGFAREVSLGKTSQATVYKLTSVRSFNHFLEKQFAKGLKK